LEDNLTRAQHYRALSAQLHETAKIEPGEKRRRDLTDLAEQYGRLADKLIGKQADQ
jgi:hypothetical protein